MAASRRTKVAPDWVSKSDILKADVVPISDGYARHMGDGGWLIVQRHDSGMVEDVFLSEDELRRLLAWGADMEKLTEASALINKTNLR